MSNAMEIMHMITARNFKDRRQAKVIREFPCMICREHKDEKGEIYFESVWYDKDERKSQRRK